MEFNIADQTCIIFPDPDPRAVSADPDSDHLLDKIFFYLWNFVLLIGPFCFEKNLKCFVSLSAVIFCIFMKNNNLA